MFPVEDFNIEDFLTQQDIQAVEDTNLGKVPKFDFKSKQYLISGGRTVYCTDVEAVQQWIEMCIRTPFNKFKIYSDTNFGNNTMYTLIGQKSVPNDYIQSQIISDLTEKILEFKMIESIENFTIKVVNATAFFNFKVNTKLGHIEGEVSVNV